MISHFRVTLYIEEDYSEKVSLKTTPKRYFIKIGGSIKTKTKI